MFKGKFGVAVLFSVFLVFGYAWADGEFKEKAERIFSSSIIYSIKDNDGAGEIIFKTPKNMPSYFVEGDKVNKVFAIESARLFKDLPTLERLKLQIPANGKAYSMNISRQEIEKFYDTDLKAIGENPDIWREEFIKRYDNKESRAEFASVFVTQEK